MSGFGLGGRLSSPIGAVRPACPWGALLLGASACKRASKDRWNDGAQNSQPVVLWCLIPEANSPDHWLASVQVPETTICTTDESKVADPLVCRLSSNSGVSGRPMRGRFESPRDVWFSSFSDFYCLGGAGGGAVCTLGASPSLPAPFRRCRGIIHVACHSPALSHAVRCHDRNFDM